MTRSPAWFVFIFGLLFYDLYFRRTVMLSLFICSRIICDEFLDNFSSKWIFIDDLYYNPDEFNSYLCFFFTCYVMKLIISQTEFIIYYFIIWNDWISKLTTNTSVIDFLLVHYSIIINFYGWSDVQSNPVLWDTLFLRQQFQGSGISCTESCQVLNHSGNS